MNKKIIVLSCCAALTVSFLGGCSILKPDVKKPKGEQEEKGFFERLFSKTEDDGDERYLIDKATEAYNKGRFVSAHESFQKVRDRYPFSPYATLAELRMADCKYFEGSYEEAIQLYQEFEKLHPNNEAVSYVVFQIAMCHYKLMNTPDRDIAPTVKMLQTCERFLAKYQESPYTFQVKRMKEEARERLAQHELVVVAWYIKTEQVAQARQRLKTIIEQYPETNTRKEAEALLATLPADAKVEASRKDRNLLKKYLPFF